MQFQPTGNIISVIKEQAAHLECLCPVAKGATGNYISPLAKFFRRYLAVSFCAISLADEIPDENLQPRYPNGWATKRSWLNG